ncbi:MAG: hypothetical protein NT028_07915 [candidate division Zixibacteria bacterium]|nr:hypothetical protein [candidate division Zixibacteria bacterium]
MQIQTGYSSNPYLSSTVRDKAPASAGQDPANENSGIESPEYKAISNKASMLLANPAVPASERVKILNLLARGKVAAANGATGELNTLLDKINNFDPGLTVKGDSFQKGTPKPPAASPKQDEGRVAYQDQSNDVGVSFSYPVAMNQYQAPLAVQAHEGEHVIIARAEAMIRNENVTTYVSIHNGYDSKGRLITTGGTTTVITHPKPKMLPIKTGNKVDIIV